jgi:hypothetical protein
MKYLKIEENKGFFLKETEKVPAEWVSIDQITKDNLLLLLNKAISTDFEMDQFKEENLGNKTHQIIYKNIFEKFTDLLSNKTRFKDESGRIYRDALEKYSSPD